MTQTELIAQKLKDGSYSLEELTHQVALPSLPSCLNEFMGRRGISTDALAGLAVMNRASLFKVMNGGMKPSRNVLIRLALALQLTCEEAQVLLKCGNCAALSAGRPRDVILMHAIIHQRSMDEVDRYLTSQGMMGLFGKG